MRYHQDSHAANRLGKARAAMSSGGGVELGEGRHEGDPCFDRPSEHAYTGLGRVLRSGPRPFSFGNTTSPAPSQLPSGLVRSLPTTISVSGRLGMPATRRPSGDTTRSASSRPGSASALRWKSND